jgi:hypothetical protein
METVQIFGLMAFLGVFCFLSFGFCLVNSIEAQKSELTANIFAGISAVGFVSTLIGLVGLIIIKS